MRLLAGLAGALIVVGPGMAGAAPVSAADAGFVEIHQVVPDAVVDLRYATPHNFVGAPLYPAGARCLVHQSMRSEERRVGKECRSRWSPYH